LGVCQGIVRAFRGGVLVVLHRFVEAPEEQSPPRLTTGV
jgi:hypothetical protein